jgi:hypothetical protein
MTDPDVIPEGVALRDMEILAKTASRSRNSWEESVKLLCCSRADCTRAAAKLRREHPRVRPSAGPKACSLLDRAKSLPAKRQCAGLVRTFRWESAHSSRIMLCGGRSRPLCTATSPKGTCEAGRAPHPATGALTATRRSPTNLVRCALGTVVRGHPVVATSPEGAQQSHLLMREVLAMTLLGSRQWRNSRILDSHEIDTLPAPEAKRPPPASGPRSCSFTRKDVLPDRAGR